MFMFSGGNYKEDKAFIQERDAKRVKFDKATGKAVTVTQPKNKPESVCSIVLIMMYRTSSKQLKLVMVNSSWQLDHTSVLLWNQQTVRFLPPFASSHLY